MSEQIDLTYVQISGPGVDALEHRKENGSAAEINETEIRGSYERIKRRLFSSIGLLVRS